MRELTATEINAVSGAGWLQDGLASLGGKTGSAVWSLGSTLSVDLPILGTINLSTIAPGLGETIGSTIGSTIGGVIESTLASVPLFGALINKLLGN